MNRNLYYAFLSLIFVALSCGDATNSNEETNAADANAGGDAQFDMENESSFQFDLIIANNIAAPVKLLTDINRVGLNHYQEEVTNPTSNLSSYATSDEKALGFGIYGADFSYKSLYGKHQDMADYLIVIRKLSDELGLTSLFDQSSYEHFDKIKSNPDSVRLFIFDKYDEADTYLRTNNRLLTATLVLTGGLIESLHLVSSQIETGDTNNEAYLIFLNQKNTLKSLVDLFNALEKEGQHVAIKKDVESLHKKFEELDNMEKYSKENIHELHVAIDAVRDKLI